MRFIVFSLCLLFVLPLSDSFAADNFWIANPSQEEDWFDFLNWSLGQTPGATDLAVIDNGGSAAISTGAVSVDGVGLGQTGFGSLSQTGGDLTANTFTINGASRYDFIGGTLSIENSFDLAGTFDITSSTGAIVAGSNSVVDLSQGTIFGSSNSLTFSGGTGSTLYLPLGVTPASVFGGGFTTQGDVFNIAGNTLIVPVGFTMDVLRDRSDLIRIEGIVRPDGSPASPIALVFDEAGVEVAPGGLFNMYNRNLSIATTSSVVGGELRDVADLRVGYSTGHDVTFTQTNGSTDVNTRLYIGYEQNTSSGFSNSTATGTFLLSGGTLSVGSTTYVGGDNSSFTTHFADGTIRQTGGTANFGADVLGATSRSRSATSTIELLDGTTSIAGNLEMASAIDSTGTLVVGNTTTVGDNLDFATLGSAAGSISLVGGSLDVANNITVGTTSGQNNIEFNQTAGDLSFDRMTLRSNVDYSLTGGSLTARTRIDLQGDLDFGGGNATINVEGEAVAEWSTGTLIGDASSTSYNAGAFSENYFAAGFVPTAEFAAFNFDSSNTIVHTQGNTLVIPTAFSGNKSVGLLSDRADLIRVEGTIQPDGSPATPIALVFDEAGVEVASDGLFNMYNRNLSIATTSSIVGGELRDVADLRVGYSTDHDATFTQTSGSTDVNTRLYIGYEQNTSSGFSNSTATGTFLLSGGTLSVGSTTYVGGDNSSFTTHFADGTFRQTGGTANFGADVLGATSRSRSATSTIDLLDGTTSIAGDLEMASAIDSTGTLVVGNTTTVGDNLDFATLISAAGSMSLVGGSLDVANNITVGTTSGQNNIGFNQTAGDLSFDRMTLRSNVDYSLTGGSLTARTRIDLQGDLDFGGGNATINVEGEAVAEWSTGTLIGDASSTSYNAGAFSENYFAAGFVPTAEFAAFNFDSSNTIVHTQGNTLVIPTAFSGNKSVGLLSDRADLIRVEGTIQPDGSPATPIALVFDEAGVEVASDGLFNMYNRNLSIATTSSIVGGELRDVADLRVGYSTDHDATFTQTSGSTDVNTRLYIGYEQNTSSGFSNSTATGTFLLSGGTLSVGSTTYVGGDNSSFTTHFADGTFRQTGGTANFGADVLGATSRSRSATSTIDLLDGTTSIAGDLEMASAIDSTGTLVVGNTTTVGDNLDFATLISAAGSMSLVGGSLDVANNITVGTTSGQNNIGFNQTAGDLSFDRMTLRSNVDYSLTGGSLTARTRIDLQGDLDFGGGNATINVEGEAVAEWSTGTLIGDASSTSYNAGAFSENYFAAGFVPTAEFAAFNFDSSNTIVHTQGSTLVIPTAFSGNKSVGLLSDRADLIRVEGTIQPDGSPATPIALVFDEAGVEVASGGLFNMYNRNLSIATTSSIVGGELRDVADLRVGYSTDHDATFTQTSGSTDVNTRLYIGYEQNTSSGFSNSTATGTFLLSGGTLSVGSTTYVGGDNSSFTTHFADGTFRQTGGTANFGADVLGATSRSRSATSTIDLLDGTTSIAGNLEMASAIDSTGTLVVGNTTTVGDNLDFATLGSAAGSMSLVGGSLDVADSITVGTTSGQNNIPLNQSAGDLSFDRMTLRSNVDYSLIGGSLTARTRIDLQGKLDFGGGNATINVEGEAVAEWSTGTLIGDASSSTYNAGAFSENYFAAGFVPTAEFAAFNFDSSNTIVHTQGSTLVIPTAFSGNKSVGLLSDRADLIRVEGTIQPDGSPATPIALVFDEAGVEVASGGLFNMYNRNLSIATTSSIVGGELRDVADLRVGYSTDHDATFTQTSGSTDVNTRLYIGYEQNTSSGFSNSTATGTFLLSGGTLSVGSTTYVGGDNSSFTTHFADGTFRQTGGTANFGADVLGATSRSRSATSTIDLLDGTTSIAGNLEMASAIDSTGTLVVGNTTTVGDNLDFATLGSAAGSMSLVGGSLDVADSITVGTTSGQNNIPLNQSAGDLSFDRMTLRSNVDYSLIGGSLTARTRIDLQGKLDFGGGNATINVEGEAVAEWSTGTLIGDASSSTYNAGAFSENYFAAGFVPTAEFAAFNFDPSNTVVHTQGSTLVIPTAFSGNKSVGLLSDRADLIRVEGTIQPDGSPASPIALVFDEAGVEVASGGLFNMYNRNLSIATTSSIVGGELRDVADLRVGYSTGHDATFTQTNGSTDVNTRLYIGYEQNTSSGFSNSTATGTFLLSGGTLSVGSTTYVGGDNSSFTTHFADGTFRQTGGTANFGADVLGATSRSRSATSTIELLDGTTSIAGNLEMASAIDSTGTLVVGNTTTVGDNLDFATLGSAAGSMSLVGGSLDVANNITVGTTSGQNNIEFNQTAGDLSFDRMTLRSNVDYSLTGGSLTARTRIDLQGDLDFGGGNATINVKNEAVAEWSTGTLIGDASSTSYFAGIDSESYFPMGFNPFTEFLNFSSGGIIHSTGTRLLVPISFSGRISRLNAEDLDISGSIVVEPNGVINANSVTLAGGSLSGGGTINTSRLLNAGSLQPGEVVGSISLNGDYTQTADGVLGIDIGGETPITENDQFSIVGSAILDGTLDVNLANGYLPDYGDEFVVLTASGGISGQFDQVSGLVDSCLAYVAQYSANEVTLVAARPGDANLDGIVDQVDFAIWNNNRFNTGTTWASADFNGDGITDVSDFNLWNQRCSSPSPFLVTDLDLSGVVDSVDLGLLLNEFNSTMPNFGDIDGDGQVNSVDLGLLLNNFNDSALANVAVPEPEMTSWLILLVAIMGAAMRKGRRVARN